LLSLRNLCKCGECALKNLNHISDPATGGPQNAGEPLAHEGGKLGSPGGGASWRGARGVSPQSFKIGDELPTPGTRPRVGPKTPANPQPTRVGKRGWRGRSPLPGGLGDVPPKTKRGASC
jgi:hypothetical protein